MRKQKKKVYRLWACKFPDTWIAEEPGRNPVPYLWGTRRWVDSVTEKDKPVRVKVTVELEQPGQP